jgi:two-component system, NarL family, sensor histidine kinase UhpB
LTAREVEFTFQAPAPEQHLQLRANLRRQVLLIFKEALNNLVRHSACKHARILLWIQDHQLGLEISDDGKGFEPSQDLVSNGHGLASMDRRAQALGGQLSVISLPGQGTSLRLLVPLTRSFL